MEQQPIYLCYENYSVSRKLIYIGQDYEDCLAQIAKEYDLTKSDIESLRDDGQTHCYHAGVELSIEEQTLNAFAN